jgi:hypothetical protein
LLFRRNAMSSFGTSASNLSSICPISVALSPVRSFNKIIQKPTCLVPLLSYDGVNKDHVICIIVGIYSTLYSDRPDSGVTDSSAAR